LRSYLGTLDTEADRLDSVESRLDLINRLIRKYGGSLDALFQKRDTIETELGAIGNLDDDIQRSEMQLKDLYDQAQTLARQLSEKRKRVAAALPNPSKRNWVA
jgi:DNA repair protein RecN (Recombination protein N)